MNESIDLSFTSEPKLVRAYLKALRKRKGIRAETDLPKITATWQNIDIDVDRVKAYKKVCGIQLNAELPLHFPHVLANSMHLAMLTHQAFPVALLGCVHLRNHTIRYRQISTSERLSLKAETMGCRFTAKGIEFDLNTTATVGDERVWSERTTFLVRQKTNAVTDTVTIRDVFFETSDDTIEEQFTVPKAIGRQYAAVGKDYNPIHLFGLTAKAFGFKRNIAHGMWSLAYATRNLEELCGDVVRMDVAFKGPLFMKSSVVARTGAHGGGKDLHVYVDGDDRPAIVGAVREGEDVTDGLLTL